VDDLRSEIIKPYDHSTEFGRISSLLFERLAAARFAGWDPFDALNSTTIGALPFSGNVVSKLVCTQAFKRSPVNLRGVLGVPKTANPVTVALAAEIYRRAGNIEQARNCIPTLISMASHGVMSGFPGWGYPFPWQAKAFYVAAHQPNIIATAYAVRELRHWQAEPEVKEAIVGACRLISAEFVRRKPDGRHYIAYVQDSDTMVHNANVWGAFVLANGAMMTGNHDWSVLAADAAAYTMNAQREDGSWVYGEAGHHQFVDSFHTGYVLEALLLVSELLSFIDAQRSIRHGFDFYFNAFFEDDGTAKYYADKRFPIDVNPAAQAIITMDVMNAPINRLPLGTKIMNRLIDHLWMEREKRFAYQRGPYGLNRIDYPRWTQIWATLALRIVDQWNDVSSSVLSRDAFVQYSTNYKA
jgi:polysaccharide biosynthesis protein VpsJ